MVLDGGRRGGSPCEVKILRMKGASTYAIHRTMIAKTSSSCFGRKKGQSFCWERMIGNDLPFHLGWDFQPIPLSNEMCAYHLIRISRRDYPFASLLPSGSLVVNSFPGKKYYKYWGLRRTEFILPKFGNNKIIPFQIKWSLFGML